MIIAFVAVERNLRNVVDKSRHQHSEQKNQ